MTSEYFLEGLSSSSQSGFRIFYFGWFVATFFNQGVQPLVIHTAQQQTAVIKTQLNREKINGYTYPNCRKPLLFKLVIKSSLK